MYSIDGKLLQEETMSQGIQTAVDVSELASGTYLYAIIAEDRRIHSGQFIKQ